MRTLEARGFATTGVYEAGTVAPEEEEGEEGPGLARGEDLAPDLAQGLAGVAEDRVDSFRPRGPLRRSP